MKALAIISFFILSLAPLTGEARLHGAEAFAPQPVAPPIVFDVSMWQPEQVWQRVTIHEDFPVAETDLPFNGYLLLRPLTTAVVVHHTAMPSGDTDAWAIHQGHLANGWEGIGYHYVVRQSGVIERGRPLEAIGAHAEHQNDHTVGICLTGNFEWEWPTPTQLSSLTRLLTFLCQTYRLPPSELTILGHCDVNATACPGTNLYGELPGLRAAVTQRLLSLPAQPAAQPPPTIARRVTTTSTTDKRKSHAK